MQGNFPRVGFDVNSAMNAHRDATCCNLQLDNLRLTLGCGEFRRDGGNGKVLEADTGSVVAEIAEPSWWVTRMVWSTDSRFLVYERWPDVTSNWAGVPQDVELVFYDTKANAGVALPLPGYAPALRSAA